MKWGALAAVEAAAARCAEKRSRGELLHPSARLPQCEQRRPGDGDLSVSRKEDADRERDRGPSDYMAGGHKCGIWMGQDAGKSDTGFGFGDGIRESDRRSHTQERGHGHDRPAGGDGSLTGAGNSILPFPGFDLAMSLRTHDTNSLVTTPPGGNYQKTTVEYPKPQGL